MSILRLELAFRITQFVCCPALEELGNSGWNWEAYEKYVKKAERSVSRVYLYTGSTRPVNNLGRFVAPVPNAKEEFRSLYNNDAVGHHGRPLLFPAIAAQYHQWCLISRAHIDFIRGDWKRLGVTLPEKRGSHWR